MQITAIFVHKGEDQHDMIWLLCHCQSTGLECILSEDLYHYTLNLQHTCREMLNISGIF